jgi:hypothetical protein
MAGAAMDQERRTKEDWKLYYEYRRLLRKVLTPTEYTVYDILVDQAADSARGWQCSYTEISDLGGGLATNTISRAILRLEGLGLIRVDRPENFNQKVPNRYHPVKWPTPTLVNLLNAESEKTLAAKNAATELRNKKCSDTTAKNAATSLQKMQTYESTESTEQETISTDVLIGPVSTDPQESFISPDKQNDVEKTKPQAASVATVPPPDSRGFFRRWREAYEAVKNDHKARSGILGSCYTEVTGRQVGRAEYSQLNQLAREHNSGMAVLEGICKLARYDVVDDPMIFLRKVLKNGEQQQQPGRPDLAGDSGKKQLVERQSPTVRSVPKPPIKPTGSGPNGLFTTDDYLADY